jgi:hypothetical protein
MIPMVEHHLRLDPAQSERYDEWGARSSVTRLRRIAYQWRPWRLSVVRAERRSRAEVEHFGLACERGM